ncbi:hypothetical protein B0H16DRAFT_1695732 [Mycena metata]|uniref:BTB domain-containing protein n=1 Tax=Mycena metata TaxID=1033252 RepID=A0AAD7MVN1_9AGAR|nr:hypothetical protein B0H16DRAFT_1695732 [Mycena metata]
MAEDTYHPLFSDDNADVVLQSVEGTSYRVHSLVLKTTSGFFRTMLSLPQPSNAKVPYEVAAGEKDSVLEKTTPGFFRTISMLSLQQSPEAKVSQEIPVGEKDSVMEGVLRMMCGLEIPRWASLDEVEAAVELIEKWDAPGPLSLIRTAVTSSLFLDQSLRIYGLTSRFGWQEETTVALIFTLRLELLNGEHTGKLHRLSTSSLLALVTFHEDRKARFKEAMNGALFVHGNQEVQICVGCQRRLDDNSLWRLLKEKLISDFNRRPLGDQLFMNMWNWPEATACFGAKCICGRAYYDQNGTVRNIQEAVKLSLLPVATLS